MSEVKPIGIFDSGIGGLTIAHALSQTYPTLPYIFYGDTAHLPYGDKSGHSIRDYSRRILTYFEKRGCELAIIACNTASAVAFKHVEQKFTGRLKILNVIDPAVNYCLQLKVQNKIGVIGTRGTIRSRAYPRRFKKVNKSLKVSSLATPLLAPMIEEGFFNNNISQTIINAYLSKPNLKDLDALILACTHYPLIRAEINNYFKGKIELIDSRDLMVKEIGKYVENINLSGSEAKSNKEYFVSDFTQSFESTTKIFFGKKVKLKELKL